MDSSVGRSMVRGAVVAALGAGVLVLGGPQAAAVSECPAGTARIFFDDTSFSCQGAGSATYASPWAVKVCTTAGTRAVIDTTGKRKINKKHVELEPGGFCAQLYLPGQESATVQVLPA